ncbi:MAG: hypothetical protein BZY80_02350 [SAR202 cluster bacterium Io17-Chloro-G2]|nr:MAG: hypothetical protein BZY80_02350 [SAR202 cluster bacterium Io17-Chloro-G2]
MKPIPTFHSEDEEREFWATHDSTEFVDWNKAQRTDFENLKAAVGNEAVNFPAYRIKTHVNWKDVLIAFVFLGIITGVLIPSYLLRNDHEWISRILGGAGVFVVTWALKYRVQQALALGIFVPVIGVIELGFRSPLAAMGFIRDILTTRYGRAPAGTPPPSTQSGYDLGHTEE